MDQALYIEKLQEAVRAGKNGDWVTVRKIAFYEASMAANIFSFLEDIMPAEVKRKIALEHYTHHGDQYPIIRKHVRNSLKARPENWREKLPEAVRHLDSFTVYRAGLESLDKAKYSLSWTLSRDVAEWFANRQKFLYGQLGHIYRATISAEKVIAFDNGRNEFEIIQYRNVKNIEEIPMQGYSEGYQLYLDDKTPGAWESRKEYLAYFSDMMRREANELPVAV